MKTAMPHQLRGTTFLVQGGVCLADDPGLGKTYQLISAFKELNPAGIGVALCPAVVLGVWERELSDEGLTPFLLTSKTLKHLSKAIGTFDFIVCSIDLVGRSEAIKDAIISLSPSVLIVDECHYLKSDSARRTRAILTGINSIAENVERVWLASGTPAPNHVGELWTLIRGTDWDRIDQMSLAQFEQAYCTFKMVKRPKQRQPVRVISGSNLIALNTLKRDLRAPGPEGQPWWLRRRKEDVLKDLPAKLRQTVPMIVQDMRPFREMEETEEGQALMQAIADGDLSALSQQSAASVGDDEDDAPEYFLSRLRRLMALAKAEAAAEYVDALVEMGHRKIIVWGWHTAALQAVSDDLKWPSQVLDGSTPKATRDAFVERFQTTTEPLIAVMQIKAMGTGITMTAADRAVFFEASFTPGDNLQAEDRIHRIGQDRGVLIDYLCIRGSLDEAVMAILRSKTEDWEQLEKSALENV